MKQSICLLEHYTLICVIIPVYPKKFICFLDKLTFLFCCIISLFYHFFRMKNNFFIFHTNRYSIASLNGLIQDQFRHRIVQLVLNSAAQRAGSVFTVKTGFRYEFFDRITNLQGNVHLFFCTLRQIFQHQTHDLLDFLLIQ